MPVEDTKGRLIGLITSTQILKFFTQKGKVNTDTTVGDIMNHNPHTVTQQMKIMDVIKLMKEHDLKMLPVIKKEELIGVISERNFVNMSKRFIQTMGSNT
jgi:CBS domain-containing protein